MVNSSSGVTAVAQHRPQAPEQRRPFPWHEAAVAEDAAGFEPRPELRGRVQPETFTHGSAAQRSSAFRQGYQGGAPACGIR